MDPREQRLREIDQALEALAEDRTYRPSRMPPPPVDTGDLGAVDGALQELGSGVQEAGAGDLGSAALPPPLRAPDQPEPQANGNAAEHPIPPVAIVAGAQDPQPIDRGPAAGLSKQSFIDLFGEDPDDPDAGSVVSVLPGPPDPESTGVRGPATSTRPPGAPPASPLDADAELGGSSARPPSSPSLPPSAWSRSTGERSGPPPAPSRPPSSPNPSPSSPSPTAFDPSPRRPGSAPAGSPSPAPPRYGSEPWARPVSEPPRVGDGTGLGGPGSSQAPGGRVTPLPDAASLWPPAREASSRPAERRGPTTRPPRVSTPPPPPPDALGGGAARVPPPGRASGSAPAPLETSFSDARPTPLRTAAVEEARFWDRDEPGPAPASLPGTGVGPERGGSPQAGDGTEEPEELGAELDDLLIIDDEDGAAAAASAPAASPGGSDHGPPETEFEDALDDLLQVTTDDAHPELPAATGATFPDAADASAPPGRPDAPPEAGWPRADLRAAWPYSDHGGAAADDDGDDDVQVDLDDDPGDAAELLSEDSVARSVSFAPDDTAAGVDALPDVPPPPATVGLDGGAGGEDERALPRDDRAGGAGDDEDGESKGGFFRRIFGRKA